MPTNIQLSLLIILLIHVNSFKIHRNSLPEAFDYLSNVDPTILQSVRYASTENFVGEVIEGYHTKTIILTKLAAFALANVQD